MLVNPVRKYGIAGAFAQEAIINRSAVKIALFPPLTPRVFQVAVCVDAGDWARIHGCVAACTDRGAVVTALSLFRIANRRYEPARFFFFAPAAMFISAFHCNIDSTMVALTTFAVLLVAGDRPMVFLAGVALAAATGIKIIPSFLVPFFSIFIAARLRFLAGYAAGFAAVFVPALFFGGARTLRSLLEYSGYPGKWGFIGLLLEIEKAIGRYAQTPLFTFADVYATFGKYILIAALATLAIWLWVSRRAEQRVDLMHLATSVAGLLVTLFLAPGFGVQYLLWPPPFLLFALERPIAHVLMGAISLYLFITYTIWSGGFPRWYADSIAATPRKDLVTILGFPLWMLVGYAAARGIMHLRYE
jgi:glycosyl transferase family 87